MGFGALPGNQSGLASGAKRPVRQTDIAVLGTLVPAGAALGGDPLAYVAGFHRAVIVASLIAAASAIGTTLLLLRGGVRRG